MDCRASFHSTRNDGEGIAALHCVSFAMTNTKRLSLRGTKQSQSVESFDIAKHEAIRYFK